MPEQGRGSNPRSRIVGVTYNAQMHRHVERVVDLLDPASTDLHNMDVDEARRARAERRSGSRPRDRRLVRARGRRRPNRPDGAIARSADALLPRQARRRGRRSSSPIASTRCSARSRQRVFRASSIRATRAWCRRITSSSSPSSAVRIRIRPTRASSRPRAERCPPISTRSAALHRRAGRRDREVAVAAWIAARVASRSASASPAASTAARCSSSPITRCCSSACRPRG